MENPTSNSASAEIIRNGISLARGEIDWRAALVEGTISTLMYSTWKLHNKTHQIQPLSSDDIERHRKLQKIFTHHFPNYHLPDIWALDTNKKPCKTLPSIESIQRKAYVESEKLRSFQTINQNIRGQLFFLIGRLFESINNRNPIKNFFTGTIREDGIEVMFFAHLIFWLEHCAPNYHEKDPETYDAYTRIYEYCKECQLYITTRNSADESRNNPNLVLERIIEILDGHCQTLKEIHDASTFADYNNQLRDNMLGLAAQSFNIVYFLINKTSETTLIPLRFLNPEEVESKVKKTRETQLGEWLAQTFHKVGITHSTFVPTKRITPEQIRYHLANQHPKDSRFEKEKILFDWGLRSFVSEEQKSENYLTSIRNILKLVLNLYFLLQQNDEVVKVYETYGSIWVYGHRAEQATLFEFLNSVTWIINELYNQVAFFWDKYYFDFQTYTKKRNLSENLKEFQPIIEINFRIIKIIENLKKEITNIVELIKAQVKAFPTDTKVIIQSKLTFMKDVLEYRRFINQTSSPEFQILCEEYERMINELQVKTIDSLERNVATEELSQTYKKDENTSLIRQVTGKFFGKNRLLLQDSQISENKDSADLIPTVLSSSQSIEIVVNPLQSSQASNDVVLIMSEQFPFGKEILSLLGTPHYIISAKTSSEPRINEYCFELKTNILQYTYLNQNGQQITRSITHPKDLESLGGKKFKCDEEHFRRYRRELIHIINPNAVAREDYESELDTKLLSRKPKPFASTSGEVKFFTNLQEEIYTKFLEQYHDVVNTPEWLTYLRVSNHRLLVDLYKRVNAVFHRLYHQLTSDFKLSQGELLFIDALLYQTIMREFANYHFYPNFSLTRENLEIDIRFDGQKLLIPFKDIIFDVTKEPIQRMIFENIGNISEREEEIRLLRQEKSALEQQIIQRNAELATQTEILAQKDELIEQLNLEIRMQKAELAHKNITITSQEETITSQEEKIERLNTILQSSRETCVEYSQKIQDQSQIIARLQTHMRTLEPKLAHNYSGFFSSREPDNPNIQQAKPGASYAS